MPKTTTKQTGLLDTWGRKNRKLKNKTCPDCGAEFRPRAAKSKYCSQRCRWNNNGGNSRPKPTFENHVIRFWSNVERADSGCWNWLGRFDRNGYGYFCMNGRKIQAHILAYELTFGKVPDGKELDHLCRNRACPNPAHVEPVTHRENILRGVAARKLSNSLQRKAGE